MKKIIWTAAFILPMLIAGCRTPQYLPTPDTIDVNVYGSYIKIQPLLVSEIKGELIAIDTDTITVLTKDAKECVTIPVKDVLNFTLKYARPKKRYWWSIPASLPAAGMHGFYFPVSLPVNLLVTVSVTASSENAFRYSEADMTYDKLRMFARFPQGIPPGIDRASIR
ncbi:MAG: hypothetical protein KF845_04040 [Cyclobacteriaceae bacterium]|nr:hypothetical protein [Cyclobacteriaceae bacterium]